MNPLIQLEKLTALFVVAFACLALLPTTQAGCPNPPGVCAGQNTAVGDNALFNLTSGVWNVGVGEKALFNDTDGNQNTATGYQALFNNVSGDKSTATGSQALYNNTTGNDNVATGFRTLYTNTSGNRNTGVGYRTLTFNNGDDNTAIGWNSLYSNTTGIGNTAEGGDALFSNTTGGGNTAIGYQALQDNTMGNANIAVGFQALQHGTGGNLNIAIGGTTLFNTTGGNNIALGTSAGSALTSGNSNIDIANAGVAGESGTIRIGSGHQHRTFIAGIRAVTTGNMNAIPVLIDSVGQLGTVSSSKRFKKEIKPMNSTSEAILALKPVTFYYKSDYTNTPQFGLIAEEVAAVNPELVVRDEKGDIYTVRYDAVNAMLLNEFLKEHRTVQEMKSTLAKQEAMMTEQRKDFESKLAQQQKQIEVLTAGLQKVSAQLEASKPAPQVVNNQ
jgi:hypothetical protein